VRHLRKRVHLVLGVVTVCAVVFTDATVAVALNSGRTAARGHAVSKAPKELDGYATYYGWYDNTPTCASTHRAARRARITIRNRWWTCLQGLTTIGQGWLGVAIAMTPYRSCAPPSTIWSARDSYGRGVPATSVLVETLLDRGADANVSKPRPRSSG
jgi:hypothetical protein